MADYRMTVTDIIVAKRREANFIVQSAEAYAKAGETSAGTPYDECDLERDRGHADEIRKEADCLEAALKHELAAAEANALAVGGIVAANRELAKSCVGGDAAKLREALELARLYISLGPKAESRAHVKDGEVVMLFATNVLDEISAALAAPPRNCDLYKTKEKAQEAFLKEPCDHPCGNCWVEDINNECGVEWLLAAAKEGGAK